MADDAKNGDNGNDELAPKPAASTPVSLSQAILAPLDAIFQSQVHAARSFLNFLQQLGYPHTTDGTVGQREDADKGAASAGASEGTTFETGYTIDFLNTVTTEDGEKQIQKISLPALSLVPVAPLAVESADYSFELEIQEWEKLKQLRKSTNLSDKERAKQRPWHLVDDPISLKGVYAPKDDDGASSKRSRSSRVEVNINVGRIPPPAALEKLLTSLGQMNTVETLPPTAPDAGSGTSEPPPGDTPDDGGAGESASSPDTASSPSPEMPSDTASDTDDSADSPEGRTTGQGESQKDLTEGDPETGDDASEGDSPEKDASAS